MVERSFLVPLCIAWRGAGQVKRSWEMKGVQDDANGQRVDLYFAFSRLFSAFSPFFAFLWARPICESAPTPSSGRMLRNRCKTGAETHKSSAFARLCPHCPHLPAFLWGRQLLIGQERSHWHKNHDVPTTRSISLKNFVGFSLLHRYPCVYAGNRP